MSLPSTIEESLIPVNLEEASPPPQIDQELIEEFYLQQPFNWYWNWCWAVVAEGFSNFLRPYDGMTQEAIASEAYVRNIRTCNFGGYLCDAPWDLHEALKIALGIEVEADDSDIPFEAIVWEIRQNTMPVGCRLLQDDGHFGVVVGFKQDGINQFVTIIINSDNTVIDWNYTDFFENRSHFYFTSGVNTWKLKYQRILKKTYKFLAKL